MRFLRTRIVAKIGVVIAIGLTLGYLVIPRLLLYPEYSNLLSFQKSVENYTQIEQYLGLGALSFVLISFLILMDFKDLFRINKEELTIEDCQKIQKSAHTSSMRVTLYFILVYFPVIVIFPLMIPAEFPRLTIYFIAAATISWVAVIGIVFSFWVKQELKTVIKKMLERTGDYSLYSTKNNLTLNVVVTLFMTTVILFMFMFLYGYSTAAVKLGATKRHFYQNNEVNVKFKDTTSFEQELKKVPLLQKEDYYFVILPDGKTITSNKDKKLTKFMIEYIKQFNEKTDTAYNSYVYTEQAYFKKVLNSNGEVIYYGHIFEVKDSNLLLALTTTLLISLFVYILMLLYWASNIVRPIKEVTVSLNSIASDTDVDYDEKLAINYNDEIGQIVDSYNKIQELNKKYINSINEKQDILIKQEQLVTLGELAGGMAHDINTPIAAINYGIDVLSKQVTDEKQMEIIRTMKDCSLKIITIVNDLRNQIRNLGTNDLTWFKFTEIVKESQVLTHNKLVKGGCTLNIDVDPNLELYGERNKLGQVITNMVVNAIQAYDKLPLTEKLITIQAYQDGDNAVIKVTDRAGGIPDQMRESMFKAIMTTKGSEGTGIGMYLAYSVIRSVFKGQLTFETATGAGTTFIMIIPNNKERINAEIKATPVTQTVLPTHVEVTPETPVVNQETSS